MSGTSNASVQALECARTVRLKRRRLRSLSYDKHAAQVRELTELGETANPKLIGIIAFDQMTAADLMAPAEVFSRSRVQTNMGPMRQCYNILTLGISRKPCMTGSGIIVNPQVEISHAPSLDTVIIPGGRGIQNPEIKKQIANWLSSRAGVLRRIAILGTGIYAIAPTGLLDGRKVVTHWRFAKDVASRFPKLRVNSHHLFLKDGVFYTCAGTAAGIDLSLSLIEEDYGPRVAMSVARELVVYFKRSGDQPQYSEPLQFQTQSVSRLSDLTTWIMVHMSEDLSLEVLAARACLCPRHFWRKFKAEFGCTPSDFVEKLRLDEARRRLCTSDDSIEHIGLSVGFKSADAFRRAFERRLEINPKDYRQRFRTSARSGTGPGRLPKLSNASMVA